jgi:5-hydroxyisourate hydrolase
MSTLSTHVLDTSTGEPASGMRVHLSRAVDDDWETLLEMDTDHDGRIAGFGDLPSGRYRLGFETGAYGNPMFPFVHVVFDVDEGREHYHLPLLLSSFAYTTYRGS